MVRISKQSISANYPKPSFVVMLSIQLEQHGLKDLLIDNRHASSIGEIFAEYLKRLKDGVDLKSYSEQVLFFRIVFKFMLAFGDDIGQIFFPTSSCSKYWQN
jgi:hypothetical protein